MNCEEYREAITANPAFDGGADHLAGCADCQAYRREMQALNVRIAKAMQLSVPALKMPELPAVETVVPLRRREPLSRPVWFAMAASVLFAVVMGVRMLGTDITYESLGEEVIAHLDHEPYALRVTDEPVSPRRLARVVPASIAELDHEAGLITYAQTCVINGKRVPHLVVQGETGPVTILLMPDEEVAEAEVLEGANIHGVILPVGSGSIAIIGPREERLERIEKRVLDSVTWTT